MSDFMNIIKSRRSTRDFKPELPPIEKIEKLIEAAEWAPSGMGKYNWHFSVVYNPEKTLKLARAIAEADNRGPDYNFYGAPVIINISCERDDRNALLNGAAAIDMADKVGTVEAGKLGDLVIWDAPDLDYICYRFGSNLAKKVIKRGCVM